MTPWDLLWWALAVGLSLMILVGFGALIVMVISETYREVRGTIRAAHDPQDTTPKRTLPHDL